MSTTAANNHPLPQYQFAVRSIAGDLPLSTLLLAYWERLDHAERSRDHAERMVAIKADFRGHPDRFSDSSLRFWQESVEHWAEAAVAWRGWFEDVKAQIDRATARAATPAPYLGERRHG